MIQNNYDPMDEPFTLEPEQTPEQIQRIREINKELGLDNDDSF